MEVIKIIKKGEEELSREFNLPSIPCATRKTKFRKCWGGGFNNYSQTALQIIVLSLLLLIRVKNFERLEFFYFECYREKNEKLLVSSLY